MADMRAIADAVKAGRAKNVKQLVTEAVEEGASADEILNQGLVIGMAELGEMFKNNEVYVPEVLIAARAMKAGMAIIKPLLLEADIPPMGTVAIGTVKGDLHDIGKNLVRLMMEGKGLEVIDLGTDVPPEMFIQAAIEHNSQVICCSALLTTTMGAIKDVITAMKAAGIRDSVKIMIGGAPITQSFCDQIGADCYTPDATTAALAAVELCKAS